MNKLDKEEFRIKLEEINRLVEKKNYKDAMAVVDSIDWRRVKNVRTLCVVGEIYAANKRYEDSKEIFLLAYHRAPIGKNILYRLIEVSLKMNDVSEAEDFYNEFVDIAPNDNTKYILKYKIMKVQKAPIDAQIKILEEYKDKEFTEKWSYELAKLYYQNGENDKCLDLCNDMVIWFNDGKYVMKALDLKSRMGKLTGAEKERFDDQFIPNLTTPDEMEAAKESEEPQKDEKDKITSDEEPVIDTLSIDERDVNSAESIQEKISKGIRDIFNGKKKDEEEFKEEEESAEGDVQDELIKDINSYNSEKDEVNVPDLEPEDAVIRAPKDPGQSIFSQDNMEQKIEETTEKEIEESEETKEIQTESKDENGTIEESDLEEETSDAKTPEVKIPELEIPESMKNIDINKPSDIEIPKAPDICLPGMDDSDVDDFDFNLEDTILAAASAQGIEIPKGPIPARKPVVKENPVEDEEYMTEEDLQSAEDEFMNGPSGKNVDSFAGNSVFVDEDDFNLDFIDDDVKNSVTREVPADEVKENIKKVKNSARSVELPTHKMSEEEELEKFIDSVSEKEASDDIIPRDKVMTEDEEKLFTYLAKVPGLKEQIIDSLCDVQMCASDNTSKTGNVIVMGGVETGKTRLISGLIPAICKELNLEASKVAYVFADQINGKNINEIVSKMAGGFLVIENANQLEKETVNQLNKAMESNTDGMIVIIEDEKISMRKLIARFPKFTAKFTSMINIPVFTNDELVNFAKIYTRENGYTIDQMGMLALYNLISVSQKEDKPMNVGAVKDIIDNAISKSKGGIRNLISKKKMNKEGYMVLSEKDFS